MTHELDEIGVLNLLGKPMQVVFFLSSQTILTTRQLTTQWIFWRCNLQLNVCRSFIFMLPLFSTPFVHPSFSQYECIFCWWTHNIISHLRYQFQCNLLTAAVMIIDILPSHHISTQFSWNKYASLLNGDIAWEKLHLIFEWWRVLIKMSSKSKKTKTLYNSKVNLQAIKKDDDDDVPKW